MPCTRHVDPTYFPGRAATIYYRAPPKSTSKANEHTSISGTLTEFTNDIKQNIFHSHSGDIKLGTLGILHPSVLEKFEIGYPCSAVEFTLEPFRKQVQKVWTNEEWAEGKAGKAVH